MYPWLQCNSNRFSLHALVLRFFRWSQNGLLLLLLFCVQFSENCKCRNRLLLLAFTHVGTADVAISCIFGVNPNFMKHFSRRLTFFYCRSEPEWFRYLDMDTPVIFDRIQSLRVFRTNFERKLIDFGIFWHLVAFHNSTLGGWMFEINVFLNETFERNIWKKRLKETFERSV